MPFIFFSMCYKKSKPDITREKNYMKLKELFKKVSVSGILAAFALCMTTLAANSTCFFVFHQPEFPEDLKKYRKF